MPVSRFDFLRKEYHRLTTERRWPRTTFPEEWEREGAEAFWRPAGECKVEQGGATLSGCPRICVHLLLQFYSPSRPLFCGEDDLLTLIAAQLRGEMSDLEIAEEKAKQALERGRLARTLLLQDFDGRRQDALQRLNALLEHLVCYTRRRFAAPRSPATRRGRGDADCAERHAELDHCTEGPIELRETRTGARAARQVWGKTRAPPPRCRAVPR